MDVSLAVEAAIAACIAFLSTIVFLFARGRQQVRKCEEMIRLRDSEKLHV